MHALSKTHVLCLGTSGALSGESDPAVTRCSAHARSYHLILSVMSAQGSSVCTVHHDIHMARRRPAGSAHSRCARPEAARGAVLTIYRSGFTAPMLCGLVACHCRCLVLITHGVPQDCLRHAQGFGKRTRTVAKLLGAMLMGLGFQCVC